MQNIDKKNVINNLSITYVNFLHLKYLLFCNNNYRKKNKPKIKRLEKA